MAEPAKAVVLRENPKMLEFRDLLHRYKDRIAVVLPRSIPIDRFEQWCMIALGRDSKLFSCTWQSVFRALIVAGQLGLDPTGVGGQAWVVAYKNQATLLVGYRGLLELARRTGIVVGVDAQVVHRGDIFEYTQGTEPMIVHRPSLDGDPGPVIAAYAIVRIRGDVKPMQVIMSKTEIDRIRTRSRAGDSGPWVTDYDAMARKSALRQVLKLAPSSTELVRAEEAENRFEQGNDADFSGIATMPDFDDELPPPMSKSDEMAQRLQTRGEEGGPGAG